MINIINIELFFIYNRIILNIVIKQVHNHLIWFRYLITIYDFAKISQNLYHFSYQCQHALDELLPSFRLLTDQIPAKAIVVDCQISIGKLLFGA